jgi:hypothetical protein
MVEDNSEHVRLDPDLLYAVTQSQTTNGLRGTAQRFGSAKFWFWICGYMGPDEALTYYSADAVTFRKKRTGVPLSARERDCVPSAGKDKSN